MSISSSAPPRRSLRYAVIAGVSLLIINLLSKIPIIGIGFSCLYFFGVLGAAFGIGYLIAPKMSQPATRPVEGDVCPVDRPRRGTAADRRAGDRQPDRQPLRHLHRLPPRCSARSSPSSGRSSWGWSAGSSSVPPSPGSAASSRSIATPTSAPPSARSNAVATPTSPAPRSWVAGLFCVRKFTPSRICYPSRQIMVNTRSAAVQQSERVDETDNPRLAGPGRRDSRGSFL